MLSLTVTSAVAATLRFTAGLGYHILPVEHRPRSAPVVMASVLTVCKGGSCGTNGGSTLLDAACVFAAGCDRELLDVKTANCCGECPVGVMIRPSYKIPSYIALAATAEQAMDSAEEAISATGASVRPEMRQVFQLAQEAERIFADGSPDDAIAAAAAALAAIPTDLLEPWQPPLEPEGTSWEGTSWEESLHGSSLVLSESTANFEFGTVGANLTLCGCEVDADNRQLSGDWEGSDGSTGSFVLTMSEDGRFFRGQLDGGEASERIWEGMRLGVGTGMRRRRRGAEPPLKAAWIHDLLLRRSRLLLARGDTNLALEGAQQAVALCCRAASGYALLAEVAEACGDSQAAAAAHRENRWLQSFA